MRLCTTIPWPDRATTCLAHGDHGLLWQIDERVLMIAIFLGLLLALDPAAYSTLVLALLLGTPVLSLIGSIGAALTVGVRRGGVLRLYVGGRLVAESASFNISRYDLAIDQPLKIGFGEQDYFTGRIEDVRLYRRALRDDEITALQRR